MEFIPNFMYEEDVNYQNLKKIYNLYYINNLINFPKDKIWLDIEEIDSEPNYDINKNWKVGKDKFLENSDWKSLAKDIQENGTYWPIYVEQEKNGYYLKDGQHRLYQLKKAKKLGWINRKFLVVVRNSTLQDVNKKQKFFWPKKVKKEFKEFYKPLYKEENNYNVSINDEKFYEIYHSQNHSYLFHIGLNLMLRNEIFDWNKNNDKKIQPLKIINDEKLWNSFIEGEIYAQ